MSTGLKKKVVNKKKIILIGSISCLLQKNIIILSEL